MHPDFKTNLKYVVPADFKTTCQFHVLPFSATRVPLTFEYDLNFNSKFFLTNSQFNTENKTIN